MITMFNISTINVHGRPRLYFDTRNHIQYELANVWANQKGFRVVKAIEQHDRTTWICDKIADQIKPKYG